ncbi:hypothetical protein [Dyella silvatica]|uniref:hypothetical protein n=1 Tax=Dyella silvatica TaxID=2992128 RepID=UPI00225B0141|nr:hypothetical protein [Dyella silvatica]
MNWNPGVLRRPQCLVLGLLLLLNGCATNSCNILSTDHSLGCKAAYAVLAVPMVPEALWSKAVDHRDDDDMAAKQAAHEQSADQLITWWGDDPPSEQMPELLKAYFYKGTRRMTSDPTQADVYLRKAAGLAADPRIVPRLNAYDVSYFDYLAKNIQADLMLLRYRGTRDRQPEPSVLKDRCQAIAAWPPAWMTSAANDNLRLACVQAYRQQFDIRLPPSGTHAVIDGIADPIVPGRG